MSQASPVMQDYSEYSREEVKNAWLVEVRCVPLCRLPLIEIPLERTGLNLIRAIRFDCMRVSLCVGLGGLCNTIPGSSAAEAFFPQVGIPKEILTDQGNRLMSCTFSKQENY